MAFSKAKNLDAAQKFLSQGKIPQAISEYQQILKNEPRDQVTLMTLGDLYVRMSDTAHASEYFEKLAQLFLDDGFTSKGIAIYKKIAKLAPDQMHPLERLADLYVQQGVMSEARPIYIQIAETHLRAKQPVKAVEVLRRLLDLEPDNLRVQMRLAELHQAIGQKTEAAHAYLVGGHRLFEKGEHEASLALVEKALELERSNVRGIQLKARITAAQGHPADAAKLIEALPDAEQGELTTQLLLEFYQQAGQPARAVDAASKVLAKSPAKFELGLRLVDSLLESGEMELTLKLVGNLRAPLVEAGEHERLAQILTTMTERVPKRLEPREWLVELHRHASDAFRLTESLDHLGDAAVSAGNLERAREAYEELLEREPQNDHNRRRLSQVRAKLGLAPLEAPAMAVRPELPSEGIPLPPTEDQPASPAEEAPAPAAAGDEETERFVSQALTDVDLFSSYNLIQKATDLLEKVLRRAPRHPVALERLLDLCLGAGNDRRTAELAAQLEEIYEEKGDQNRVERFADLRQRFGRASAHAGEAPRAAPAVPPEFAIPTGEAEPASAETAPAGPAAQEGAHAVHELDLSEDWAALANQAIDQAPPSAPPEGPAVPEAVETAETPAAPVAETPQEIQMVVPETPSEEAPPAVHVPEELQEAGFEEIELSLESEIPATTAPPAEEVKGAPQEKEEEALEYDLELSSPPAGKTPAGANASTKELLADLARELDNIGIGPEVTDTSAHAAAPAPPPAAPVAPASPAAVAASAMASAGTTDHLREVFEEFRAELGEMGEEEEDLETHYNLGIAYREMDLFEESIGEFQKVAKLIQSGRPFRYAMQCYTLLGLAFMDRGEPKIASMWYQKALGVSGLDQESILALRYDLGVAQDLAGEKAAALDSFTQVYAINIDYRDVADRIAGLQKRR